MGLFKSDHNKRSNGRNHLPSLSDSMIKDEKFPSNETRRQEDDRSSDSDPEILEDDQLKPSNIHVFSASSTLHGFSHIFASHHSTLRRFSWTVAFLTSLTLFLLQVRLN